MKCLMPGGINAIHDLFAMQVFLSAFISFVKSRALLFLINNDLRLGVLLDGFLVLSAIRLVVNTKDIQEIFGLSAVLKQ